MADNNLSSSNYGILGASSPPGFEDPYLEENPFADSPPSRTQSPHLHSSRSLGSFQHEISGGNSLTGTGGFEQHGPSSMYTSQSNDSLLAGSNFQKSFSAMNLANPTPDEIEDLQAPTSGSGRDNEEEPTGRIGGYDQQRGSEDYQHEQQARQRWDSAESHQRYDSDEPDDQGHHHDQQRSHQQEGNFRPESTRSVGSQLSFRVPETGVLPWFDITVGEPQKVGDAINAHITYKVRIKTNSNAFKSNDFTVQRRYRDFLWLYNQLTTHNPGVIVPPVSEKHALGRFQDEFVESRRIALERCLRKMTAHPMLYGDPDLKLFLESDSLVAEIKEKRSDSSKGFMTKFGETLSSATTFIKVTESDEWFESRKNQLDVLDSQLKSLLKAIEAIIKQRKDLGQASAEFGESIVSLAGAELNKPLANSLLVLGNLKIRIKELHDRQAHMDVLTLEHTVDEYIRTIGSIKIAFMARSKFNQSLAQAQNDYTKKKANFDKLSQPSRKTRPEKLQQLQHEITEAEQRQEMCSKDFDEISKLIRQEFDRFDREKIEDFKQSVEAFLESMVQHQREIVELWENYFKALNGAAEEQYQYQQQQKQERSNKNSEDGGAGSSTTVLGGAADIDDENSAGADLPRGHTQRRSDSLVTQKSLVEGHEGSEEGLFSNDHHGIVGSPTAVDSSAAAIIGEDPWGA